MKKTLTFRLMSAWVLVSFLATTVIPPRAYAQTLNLPVPGTMVGLTPAFMPVLMKGVRVHPENPLLFDFIVDSGRKDLKIDDPAFKVEAQKLIKYFLASLTIKEEDLWVNLSPYEKDRIIPQELGKTEMGRDMLAQDYILKQLTASLIYPEKDLGKAFWNRIYTKAKEQFGTTDIPVDTFNKVWITSEKSKIFERNNIAYVVGAHLKVMLESDYQAAQLAGVRTGDAVSDIAPAPASARGGDGRGTQELAKQVIRDIVIPEIEKEVNEGQNFALLRQMFYSMILASWYKLALKDALLNQVYSNKDKTSGVLSDDPAVSTKIYDQYLQAYKKGVFNYIKEDVDALTRDPLPRKYFSGGLNVRPENAEVVHANRDVTGEERTLISNAQSTSGSVSVAFKRENNVNNSQKVTDAAVNEKEVLAGIRILRRMQTKIRNFIHFFEHPPMNVNINPTAPGLITKLQTLNQDITELNSLNALFIKKDIKDRFQDTMNPVVTTIRRYLPDLTRNFNIDDLSSLKNALRSITDVLIAYVDAAAEVRDNSTKMAEEQGSLININDNQTYVPIEFGKDDFGKEIQINFAYKDNMSVKVDPKGKRLYWKSYRERDFHSFDIEGGGKVFEIIYFNGLFIVETTGGRSNRGLSLYMATPDGKLVARDGRDLLGDNFPAGKKYIDLKEMPLINGKTIDFKLTNETFPRYINLEEVSNTLSTGTIDPAAKGAGEALSDEQIALLKKKSITSLIGKFSGEEVYGALGVIISALDQFPVQRSGFFSRKYLELYKSENRQYEVAIPLLKTMSKMMGIKFVYDVINYRGNDWFEGSTTTKAGVRLSLLMNKGANLAEVSQKMKNLAVATQKILLESKEQEYSVEELMDAETQDNATNNKWAHEYGNEYPVHPRIGDTVSVSQEGDGLVLNVLLGENARIFLYNSKKVVIRIFADLGLQVSKAPAVRKFIQGGDVLGLHDIYAKKPNKMAAGLKATIEAGLIPELPNAKSMRLARSLYPNAFLAQTVKSGGLVEAVNAGADVLIANTVLEKDEISAARQAASNDGKDIVVVAGINMLAQDVSGEVKLATANGSDALKLKPMVKGGADNTNEALALITRINEEYPTVPITVASGINSKNRTTFPDGIKAAMGPDTVDDIATIKEWAHVADSGQNAPPVVKRQGGIDLNAKKMDMDVTKDGRGVEMTFDPAMVAEFKRWDFTGVEGVILNIVPIANPLLLLGLEANPADKQSAKG